MQNVLYTTVSNQHTGLSKERYCEIIHDLIEVIKKNELTIGQAQKILIDCADLILNIKITPDSTYNKRNIYESSTYDTELYELKQIRESLDYLPMRLSVNKSW